MVFQSGSFWSKLTKHWSDSKNIVHFIFGNEVIQDDYMKVYTPLGATTCRILCSVLLSAAVIVVRPALIIHWRQVKEIKSYLTLFGGSRSHGQVQYICVCHYVDVILWMSLCWCPLWMSLCWCHSIQGNKLISLYWYHFENLTLLMSLCFCLFIDVTLLMSIFWCHSINNKICEWAAIVILFWRNDWYI